MKIELFYAAGCAECAAHHKSLQTAVQRAAPEVIWREIDAVTELDYLVELGVASLPAVVIDGAIAFPYLPTAQQLVDAVLAKTAEASLGRR